MNNLSLLIRNNINTLIGSFQAKTKKKSFISAAITLGIGILAIFAIYFFQAYSMFDGLGRTMGLYDLCLFHAISTSLTVVVLIGVMRVTGKQKTNDSNLLLSMPIKKIDVVISKIIVRYVFDLAFMLLLFLPYFILYLIMYQFKLSVLLIGLLIIFTLPLLSVGVSNLCDFIITHLFNKSKYAGLWKSIFSLSVFILIMALLLVKTFGYGTVTIASQEAYFADRAVSNMLLKALTTGDTISILILLALTIVPFILGLITYYNSFGKTYVQYTSKEGRLKFNNGKSSFGSMFKKELNFYCSTPAYVVNTMIGPVLCVALSIILLISQDGMILGLLSALSRNYVVIIFALINCSGCALTTISCSSISLEGKSFWILKSSPISEKTLFLSKALLNVVLVVPFLLIANVLFAIKMQFSLLEILIILGLPILVNLIVSFGGLLINILFPKLKWEDETIVIKQSLATLLTMVFGMIISVLPIVLFSLTEMYLLSILLPLVIDLVLLITIFSFLFTKGIKIFRKIN